MPALFHPEPEPASGSGTVPCPAPTTDRYAEDFPEDADHLPRQREVHGCLSDAYAPYLRSQPGQYLAG